MNALRAAVHCLPATLAIACSIPDGVLGGFYPGSGGAGTAGAGTGSAAGAPARLCGAQGPLLTVRSDTGEVPYQTCASRVAETTLLNALCSCSDVGLGDFLETRGFASNQLVEPEPPPDSGASVGVNGTYVMPLGYTDVGGSFTVAGTRSLDFVGYLRVRGDLRAAGDVTVAGLTQVARSAWLGGSFLGLGPLDVAGDLHHQGTVVALPTTATSIVQEPVSVRAPCACTAESIAPVADWVAQARDRNDNPIAMLDAATLGAVDGNMTLALACGSYFLETILGAGDVTLAVSGRVALFVGGPVDLTGSLGVEFAPDAELDVFVSGDFRVTGRTELAERGAPAKSRLYVAGAGELTLADVFVGNLYAPGAHVTLARSTEVWGSLFAAAVDGQGYLSILYDRAISAPAAPCELPLPAAGCSICGTCANGLACVDGSCGDCRGDEDCCSQMVCTAGRCEILQIR